MCNFNYFGIEDSFLEFKVKFGSCIFMEGNKVIFFIIKIFLVVFCIEFISCKVLL